MARKTVNCMSIALCTAIMLGAHALAADQPRMPYVFEKFCFPCHREHVQVGPVGIFDMRSKAGNPLNRDYIRSNVRFGYNAMPAFRPSEINDKAMGEIVSYLEGLAAYRKTHAAYQPAPERKEKK